jgi:hypothetical protein
MKKEGKQKLTLSKETVAILEAGKLINVVGGDTFVPCATHYGCPVLK